MEHASFAEDQAAVKDNAKSQGYVIVVKRTKRVGNSKEGDFKVVYYQCSQSNAPVERSGPGKRMRPSRDSGCPFRANIRNKENQWLVEVINAEHNHEAFAHPSAHPQ